MDEELDGMAGDDECMDLNAPKLERRAEGDSSGGAATRQNPRSPDEVQGLNPGRELVWTDPSMGIKIWTRLADGAPSS